MTPNWTLNPFGMFIRFQVHRRQEALRCILEYGPPKFPRHANLFSLSQGHEESPQRADLPVRLLSFWNLRDIAPFSGLWENCKLYGSCRRVLESQHRWIVSWISWTLYVRWEPVRSSSSHHVVISSKGLLSSRQLPSFNEVLVLVGGVKTRNAGVAAVRRMRTSWILHSET